MVPLAHPSHPLKRHLDQLAVFAGLTDVTNRYTDHTTPSVATGMHLMHGLHVMQPKKWQRVIHYLHITIHAKSVS